MSANWINDNLASFADDTVRVELGPQIIELDCTTANLADEVTHPQYRIGGIDAYGQAITADIVDKGGKMHCVDWRSKHVPHLWKVYQLMETGETEEDGKPVMAFGKVNEFEDKDEALSCAIGLTGGAN